MSLIKRSVATIPGVVLLFCGCDLDEIAASSNKYTDEFQFGFDAAAGVQLDIENFNGSVEVYGWDKNRVEVNGTKTAGTKEALDALKVDVTYAGGIVRGRSIRPMDLRRINMGVRYRIHVPTRVQNVRLVSSNGQIRLESIESGQEAFVRTSNGPVRVLKYRGDLNVETSNGPVELSEYSGGARIQTSNGRVSAAGITGHLDATTSNGGIHADLSSMQSSRPVKLRTSNGPVSLTLNSTAATDITVNTSNGPITVNMGSSSGARVKATTSNSSISTELPLNNVMTMSKSHVEGVIGSGGALLDLRTSNGSIQIRKN